MEYGFTDICGRNNQISAFNCRTCTVDCTHIQTKLAHGSLGQCIAILRIRAEYAHFPQLADLAHGHKMPPSLRPGAQQGKIARIIAGKATGAQRTGTGDAHQLNVPVMQYCNRCQRFRAKHNNQAAIAATGAARKFLTTANAVYGTTVDDV